MRIKLEAIPGEQIDDYIKRCIAVATASEVCIVAAKYDGIPFDVYPTHETQVRDAISEEILRRGPKKDET